MSALYSEKVGAMTLAPPLPRERLRDVLHLFERQLLPNLGLPAWSQRVHGYFKFLVDSCDDLNLLVAENILVLPTHQQLLGAFKGQTIGDSAASIPNVARLFDKSDICAKAIARAQLLCPPYFPDIAPGFAILMAEPNLEGFEERLRQIAQAGPQLDSTSMLVVLGMAGQTPGAPMPMAVMLAGLASVCAKSGIAPLFASPIFQKAFWAAQQIFSPLEESDLPSVGQRAAIQAQLAHAVLERHLPAVDALPIATILEVRRKRFPEIERFRTGLAELATQVDLSRDVQAQVSDLVSSKIDPALLDLQAALHSARMDALRIGQSWQAIAGATVPMMVSHAAGASVGVNAYVGAVGAILGPLLGAAIDRNKLTHANKWSILLRLKRLKA